MYKKILILSIFLLMIVAMVRLATIVVDGVLMGEQMKLEVILVNEDDSQEMQMLSGILLKSDEITEKFHIVEEQDREHAMQLIEENQAVACIIFPEEFLHSVMNGSNYSPLIIMKDSVGLEQGFMENLVFVLEDMMRQTQSGVYTILDGVKQEKGQDSEIVYDANFEYISYLIQRERIFHIQEIEYVETVPLYEHYVVTLGIFFLFLSTTIFYQEMSFQTEGKVRKQMNTMGNVGTRLFWMKIAILILVYGLLLGGVAGILGADIRIAHMFCVILSASCMILFQIGIFGLWKEFNVGVLMNFVLHTIFLFLAGGIIPQALLPDVCHTLSRITPMYYIQSLLFGTLTTVALGNICVVTIGFIIALIVYIQWRIKKA